MRCISAFLQSLTVFDTMASERRKLLMGLRVTVLPLRGVEARL